MRPIELGQSTGRVSEPIELFAVIDCRLDSR